MEEDDVVTTDALADDLFSAGFDDALEPKEEGEVKDEPTVKDEPSVKDETEPEPEKKLEPVAEVKEITPAPVFDSKTLAADIAAALKPAPVADAPAGPTPEEIAAEEQYRKDWPEQAAREDRLKAEIEGLKTLLTTTVDTLKGQIQPVIESAAVSAEELHLKTITTAHPDVFEIHPALVSWINAQPRILQPQYNNVLENGTAADIVELVSLYKETLPKVDPEPKIDPVKEDRLKRMETTGTVRTSVTTEPDPEDFDSAFDQAAKKF